jgi:hypothetical protein
MKISKLLKYLLTGLTFYIGDDDAGGGADDYGDAVTLADGAEADTAATTKEPVTDPLAETEVEVEEEGEENAADDKAKGKKDTRIPLARHKELLEKGRQEREALAAELEKYKQGTQVAKVAETIDATETKLIALETEYNKLLADGEIDKATAKMTEIRRTERTINDQKSQMAAQAAEARAYERVRYDTVVERIEEAYPIMNPDHEDFDEVQVKEVLDLQNAYRTNGMTPAAALQKAVKILLGAGTAKAVVATTVTPNVAKEDVAKARKEAAVGNAVAGAKGTPPSTAKVGLNSDDKGGALDAEKVMKMSQKDFDALDEKTLSKLRGDDF